VVVEVVLGGVRMGSLVIEVSVVGLVTDDGSAEVISAVAAGASGAEVGISLLIRTEKLSATHTTDPCAPSKRIASFSTHNSRISPWVEQVLET